MRVRNYIYVGVGVTLWIAACAVLFASFETVQSRVERNTEEIFVALPLDARLRPGDGVYLSGTSGLSHVGEVSSVDQAGDRARLSLQPGTRARLNVGTTATCWQAPLPVEQALPVLFPRSIQDRMSAQLVEEWSRRKLRMTAAWTPVVRDLAETYVELIRHDIQLALQKRNEQLWQISKRHGEEVVESWPKLQRALGPVLEKHLTPVLSRLMNDAISEAPKISIAWSVARGQNEEAYQKMLNFMGEYLALMSEQDKAELERAIEQTWRHAKENKRLQEEVAALARSVLEDQELRVLIADVYEEAIVGNPRTTAFLRQRVLESPEMQKHLYDLVEEIAPMAEQMLSIWLFDTQGRTRPEIVQFVRSTALDRNVSWLTLETGREQKPLEEGQVLQAGLRGAAATHAEALP
ncbi:MAG: hypothetical protein ACPGXK_11260 [Phycisphaerae bacterium]